MLATGSIPTLPPIRGLVRLDGPLHQKVHAFRSLDDCRRLDAAVPTARRAVVVGGGLLGLQVARALSVRGLATEVVEGGEHLLRSQVGAPAGAVLARDLRRLGTTVYTGARAVRLTDAPGPGPRQRLHPGDRPGRAHRRRPALHRPGRRAGLTVRRGIVVDDRLRSVDDGRLHAIGDCAEHPTAGRTGFVPPAWEQAGVLAARLAGEDATYDGSRSVARLRATDLDVAVLGDPERAEGQVVEVTNPVLGTHRKLVVRDGVIVGRHPGRRPLPDRPAHPALRPRHRPRPRRARAPCSSATGPPAGASRLPDDAEVCACAGVTAGAVRGCASLDEVPRPPAPPPAAAAAPPAVRQLLATPPPWKEPS